MSFDEYLIENSKLYKIKLSAMEIGLLHSILTRYITSEENKDRGIDIANITNNRLKEVITKIYAKGR